MAGAAREGGRAAAALARAWRLHLACARVPVCPCARVPVCPCARAARLRLSPACLCIVAAVVVCGPWCMASVDVACGG
jgi:hypothetical protein